MNHAHSYAHAHAHSYAYAYATCAARDPHTADAADATTARHGPVGNLLDAGVATGTLVTCPHGGRAAPTVAPASDAVLLDGLPVATAASGHAVTGCTHTTDGTPTPCTSVRWNAGHDGVRVDGAPVLLDITDAQCLTAGLLPQGRPLVVPAQRGVAAE